MEAIKEGKMAAMAVPSKQSGTVLYSLCFYNLFVIRLGHK